MRAHSLFDGHAEPFDGHAEPFDGHAECFNGRAEPKNRSSIQLTSFIACLPPRVPNTPHSTKDT